MALENYGLLIDYKYCSGCHACEVACKQELGLGTGKWGIKLAEKGPYKLEGDDNWDWDYVPIPTELCNLCEERVAAGKKPSCVHHCLSFCMDFGPVEELAVKMAGIDHKVVIFKP